MFKVVLLAAALTIAPNAVIQDNASIPSQQAEEEGLLDPITAQGQTPNPNGPNTGKVLMRPVYHFLSRHNISRVKQVNFVFVPVSQRADGLLTLRPGAETIAYNIPVIIPTLSHEENFPAIDIDLPEGTYALSHVSYKRKVDPSTFFTEVKTYCMSNGTMVFDVENGTTGYLGKLDIADLTSNRARARFHQPIIANDTNLETLNHRVFDLDSIDPLPTDIAAFESEEQICTKDHFRRSIRD